MIKRRDLLAGGAAAALAASGAPASAAYEATPIAGTVTLGLVGPFSGELAPLGIQMQNGVQAALDASNQLRGTLDKQFTLRTFDDQNLLASALVNAQFAVDDPNVICVIGHLSGKDTDSVLPTYVQAHMPVIVPASSYDPITMHAYGNVLRLPTKDSTEGQFGARYVSVTHAPKMSVAVTQDGDYGPDVAAGYLLQMNADKVPSAVVTFPREKADYGKAAQQVLAQKPDAVYLAGLTADMGPLILQLSANGYTGPLVGSQGFFDAATIAKYGKSVEGFTVSASMPPLILAPTVLRIVNDFSRRYGAFTPVSAFCYAAAQIVIATVKRTGVSDRLSLARQLAISMPYSTVVGNFQFSGTGDPIEPNVYFYTVTDGKWRYTRAARPNDFILK